MHDPKLVPSASTLFQRKSCRPAVLQVTEMQWFSGLLAPFILAICITLIMQEMVRL